MTAPPGVRVMSTVRWVLVALAAAAALFSITTVLVARGDASHPQALYHCPMHPSVVQDHPGECPICSMTLVPGPPPAARPDAGRATPGLAALDLTPERIQLIGLRTAPVERAALAGELRTVGVVSARESGLWQVNARFGGWIERLLVAETGARVTRGQLLATIYSPEVLKAEEELLVTRGWATGGDPVTRNLGDNARRRLELLGVAGPDIEALLRAGRPTASVPLRAPASGYVVTKNAVAGLAIQPGTVLFEIADLSTVWVTAEVYESDLARVRVGQPARLTLTAFPGETHTGTVKRLLPTLDGQTRTLRVRLELPNRIDREGPRLRPGMSGTVTLALPTTSGLMVPAEAVVDTGEARYVFVAGPNGHFEPRAVTVGARAQGRVEILRGLAEGERVVTTGNFLVDSESRLRAAVEAR
jgi:Cu(I)/Ag(I) efflux system membrane fusion protein